MPSTVEAPLNLPSILPSPSEFAMPLADPAPSTQGRVDLTDASWSKGGAFPPPGARGQAPPRPAAPRMHPLHQPHRSPGCMVTIPGLRSRPMCVAPASRAASTPPPSPPGVEISQ